MRLKVNSLHLLVGNCNSGLILSGVQRRLDAQAGLGSRRPDQLDDGFVTDQRAGAHTSRNARTPPGRLPAIHVRTLSEVTRRERFGMRGGIGVRRVTFDRVVGMKPRALAADAATYGI